MFNKKGRIVFSVLPALFAFSVLTPVFGGQEAKKPSSPVPVISTSSLLQPMGIPAAKLGIFTLSDDGSIKLLDAKTRLTYGPYLKGQLGSSGGMLLDVVLDKKGKTAIIGNAPEKKIYFVSLANAAAPTVLGSVTLSFFVLDIALTPNGKFALVTGAYPNKMIACINVKTRTLVQELSLPSTYNALAIAVAKDNQTVVTADDPGKGINFLLMDPKTGVLTHQDRRTAGAANPINIVISPDGKSVFALSYKADQATCGFGYLYLITAPGVVTDAVQSVPAPSADLSHGHGAVFSKDGKKLYVLGSLKPDADGFSQHFIYVFNVAAPGTAAYSGVSIKIYDLLEQSGNWFGVDTMALTPDGKYIYLSNHSGAGAQNYIAVVDLKLNIHAFSLIACDDEKYPVGIAFKAF